MEILLNAKQGQSWKQKPGWKSEQNGGQHEKDWRGKYPYRIQRIPNICVISVPKDST